VESSLQIATKGFGLPVMLKGVDPESSSNSAAAHIFSTVADDVYSAIGNAIKHFFHHGRKPFTGSNFSVCILTPPKKLSPELHVAVRKIGVKVAAAFKKEGFSNIPDWIANRNPLRNNVVIIDSVKRFSGLEADFVFYITDERPHAVSNAKNAANNFYLGFSRAKYYLGIIVLEETHEWLQKTRQQILNSSEV